jgi:NADPH-dependent 2,4-dienoyl-CoA reductase/sulfur reductase-like enzyme
MGESNTRSTEPAGSLTSGFLIAGDPAEFNPERWGTGTLPQRHLETNLDVLIIGAGLAGLMTALECWRKGHNVVGILERSEGPVYAGKLS